MPRKTLAGAALLVVLVCCRDGPTTPELPVELETPVTTESIAQPDVLLTVRQMLDDPLVLEVVEALGDQTVAYGFEDLRHEFDRQATQGDMLVMQRRLMVMRDLLVSGSEEADVVLRDVLKLVLDDAGQMLVAEADAVPAEEAEGERVRHGER
jgi:hypothetical protein